MRRVMLSFLLTSAILTSCTSSGAGKREAGDNRMNDPAILESDRDLHIGDLGMEAHLQNSGRLRSLQYQTELVKTNPNPAIAPIDGDYANNVIAFGKLFLGTPYEYGSVRDDPSTFDCSDFTRWAFLGSLGMDLPMDSRSQARYVETYSMRSYTDPQWARPGDLLFFMSYKGPKMENYQGVNPARETITHTGIYLGNGYILHTASQATGGVRIDNMFGTHLEWRFIVGGGILP